MLASKRLAVPRLGWWSCSCVAWSLQSGGQETVLVLMAVLEGSGGRLDSSAAANTSWLYELPSLFGL